MAHLLAAVEAAMTTDFAILAASQEDCWGAAGTQTFAASAPGSAAFVAGTRYASLSCRVERWDGRPPEAAQEWEDEDELPWAAVPGGGPLRVGGFDGPEGDGLDVDGLDRARMQVLAAGRHRYGYSSEVEEPLPERWLLRLWPEPAHGDALSGRPRRLAGPLPFARSGRGWAGAMQEWSARGWSGVFVGLEPFRVLLEGLLLADGPCTEEELSTRFGPWPRGSGPAPEGWDAPAVRPSRDPQYDADRRAAVQLLADAAGMPSVETFRDALTCLRRLDLVLTTTTGLLVASPAPAAAWDVVSVDASRARSWQQRALQSVVGHLWGDLLHLVRWSTTESLTTTPRRIAIRQSVPVEDVLSLLELARLRGMTEAADPAPDDTISVHSRSTPA